MPWETEIRVGVDVSHRLCLWEMDKTFTRSYTSRLMITFLKYVLMD